jgi:hypothetical protein
MKRHLSGVVLFAFSSLVVTSTVWADWDPGDPYKMHYPQLPNLADGLDVLAGPWVPGGSDLPSYYEKFLADDWLCTESGPVTDIHIWGSYNEDKQLVAPANAYFSIAIYDNVPADATVPYSRPGNVLWDGYMKATATRLYAQASEQFFDPNGQAILGPDTEVWQYNFQIPEADAFHQTEGEIYWLGIHHSFDLNGDNTVSAADLTNFSAHSPGTFGWKTSGVQHFEDDAVYTDVYTFGVSPHVVPSGEVWSELRHPSSGESLDLAFVITTVPEPASVLLLALGAVGFVAMLRR